MLFFVIIYNNRDLHPAARQVMGDLMAARMKAVKENNQFIVLFNSPNANEYTLLDDDNNSGDFTSGEATTIKNIKDEYYDVTLVSTNSPIFHPRGTATNLTNVPTVTLNLDNSTASKTVDVSIAGRVKIN